MDNLNAPYSGYVQVPVAGCLNGHEVAARYRLLAGDILPESVHQQINYLTVAEACEVIENYPGTHVKFVDVLRPLGYVVHTTQHPQGHALSGYRNPSNIPAGHIQLWLSCLAQPASNVYLCGDPSQILAVALDLEASGLYELCGIFGCELEQAEFWLFDHKICHVTPLEASKVVW